MKFVYFFLIFLTMVTLGMGDLILRQCEPIKIEMCRNIGYNETSMPNLVGNELQSEAEYTLQTFSPLIEYVCSIQLKLFLCATYVPMCTPKVPAPIGPCRALCESVRTRCNPVLQGFGYPWPPALDCKRFPKENNHETMCMEGPGEEHEHPKFEKMSPANTGVKMTYNPKTITKSFECPGYSKLYVKLHRSGRCAQLCESNILFGSNEKHIAELWTHTWTYVAVSLALLTIASLLFSDSRPTKLQEAHHTQILLPLMGTQTMVTIGWMVRFLAGRTATSCGIDPQLPNISLLLVDGLSNALCATTFILRYYFGMAACAWWAILCLGWHRDMRRASPDSLGHIILAENVYPRLHANKMVRTNKLKNIITNSNLARFLAWGLPAFQTTAVIVARLVDADELLGTCYVGNQSDNGLQILVATPLFCYWIFGSVNLASGFFVYRRNRDSLRNTDLSSLQLLLETKCCISGMFLFVYCVPYALLILAVIYEFANIDIWLNKSPYGQTPEWPFLTRAFMELMLGIICSACILGPKINLIYKRQTSGSSISKPPLNVKAVPAQHKLFLNVSSVDYRGLNKIYSNTSYRDINKSIPHAQSHFTNTISLNQLPNYSSGRNKSTQNNLHPHLFKNAQTSCNYTLSFKDYDDETIL